MLSALEHAAATIAEDGLVVVPTETVYGIACKPVAEAIERIYELKRRPAQKSMQLLVEGAAWLERVSQPSDEARALAAAFWPGPLTLVVRAGGEAPAAMVSQGTIGVRVPAHQLATDLLARTGPLAASSANLSGTPTPPTVDGIRAVFGDAIGVYLDGGPAPGTGSTVVDLTTDAVRVLREGPVTTQMLRDVLGSRFEGV